MTYFTAQDLQRGDVFSRASDPGGRRWTVVGEPVADHLAPTSPRDPDGTHATVYRVPIVSQISIADDEQLIVHSRGGA